MYCFKFSAKIMILITFCITFLFSIAPPIIEDDIIAKEMAKKAQSL